MTPKFLSFLICSRKRVEKLRHTIDAICSQIPADEVSKIEFLLKFDNDDTESIDAIAGLPHDKVQIKTIVSDRLGGYCDCWQFLNDLARISSGRFLMVWNDDALFKTQDWFSIFKSIVAKAPSITSYWFAGTTTMIYEEGKPPREDEWPCFMAHHRRLYEITGALSGVGGTDSFLYYMLGPLGLFQKIPEIVVDHTPWFQVPEEERDLTAKDNSRAGQMTPTDFNEVRAFQARIVNYTEHQRQRAASKQAG